MTLKKGDKLLVLDRGTHVRGEVEAVENDLVTIRHEFRMTLPIKYVEAAIKDGRIKPIVPRPCISCGGEAEVPAREEPVCKKCKSRFESEAAIG